MQKLKNNEAQLKFTGSYKKKKACSQSLVSLSFYIYGTTGSAEGEGPGSAEGGVGDLQTLVATN